MIEAVEFLFTEGHINVFSASLSQARSSANSKAINKSQIQNRRRHNNQIQVFDMSEKQPVKFNNRCADSTQDLPFYAPAAWLPYFQLMRLDRPHGILYFYLPHLFGVLHAATTTNVEPLEVFRVSAILFVAVIPMRGAVCAWNDLIDAPLDRQVERTKHRPIARGAISPSAAMVFIVAQALCAAAWLLLLPFNCAVYTIPAIAGSIFYPWSKRVTDCPQLVCALTLGWAVMVGESALDVLPFRLESPWMSESALALPPKDRLSVICLYAANAAWNLCYEVMYSYQDVKDDEAAGVRNLALMFRTPAAGKRVLSAIAGLQITLLGMVGWLSGYAVLSWYFLGTVCSTGITLAMKIHLVRLQDPESCRWWFKMSGMITGLAMLSGFVLEYVYHYCS